MDDVAPTTVTIGLLVDHSSDARLLSTFLSQGAHRVELLTPSRLDDESQSVSLIIADVAAVRHCSTSLMKLRQRLHPQY